MMFRGPFARQREKLALRLDEVLRQYLSDTAAPEVSDTLNEVYGKESIGRFPERHEMRFFLDDVNCFTPELANRLRRLVSGEFPKWTVVPQFDGCVFTVRPDGVEFDGYLVKGDVREDTPAFARWKASALECDERRSGSLRRQLRWVVPKVPECLKLLELERVVPVGAFYHSAAGEGHAVWLLVSRADRNVSFGSVEFPKQLYDVNPDGSLRPRYSQPNPPVCLLVFHCQPPHPTQVVVTSDDEGVIATVPFPPVVNESELRGDCG